MSLADIIAQKIKEHGPMSVAEYMSLALSEPYLGYYMRKDPLGAEGDFTTAPEISQIFGELIGAWIAQQWMHLGMPDAALIELGPGRGTLMADALRATKHIAGFHSSLTVHLVETSPALKHKQWNALAKTHPHIEWHETINALPDDKPWLLIANEFFDALPIRQFMHKDNMWHERMVDVDNSEFIFSVMPAEADIQKKLDSGFRRNDGEIIELCEPALEILRVIGEHIATKGGAAMIADYGYIGGTNGDTLQAVKNHKYHNVLKDAGEADLTAHVDFSALMEVAQHAGATVYGPYPQGRVLGKLGAIPRATRLCEGLTQEGQATIMSGLKRLLAPDEMGELFKMMCIMPKHHPTPEGFE
ncbi:MAG: class I SAM-dependent methyltransferase [Alphaproteobacteria bacterium]